MDAFDVIIHKFLCKSMVSEQIKKWFSYRSGESIRRPLVVFLAILPLHMLYAQLSGTIPCPVTWGPTVQISNTAGSAFVPRFAVVGDTVHVVYPAGAMYYRRSIDGGKTWEAQMELVPADSMPGQIFNRPFAATGSYVYFVWGNRNASGATTSVKVRRSTNGGGSWLEPHILVGTPPTYNAPIVAAYGGDVYVAMRSASVFHVFFMRSTDFGVTWDSVHQITFGGPGHSAWDIAVTSGGVHIVGGRYDQPSALEVGYVVSTDRGVTWSVSQVLSTIDNHRAWEPQVAASGNATVYACWPDAKYGSIGGFAGTIILRKSFDNGVTWSSEIRISPLPSAVHSSMSAVGSNVHIIWDDERNGTVNSKIQYSMSCDNGMSWSAEETVGDTLDLDIDASVAATNDRVHVGWSSRLYAGDADIYYRSCSLNPTSVNQLNDAISNDGPWLSQNYPNPFNIQTTVQFTVARMTQIRLSVYDILGRELRLLRNGMEQPGMYTLILDSQHLATGVYLLVLRTAGRKEVRRTLLVK